jgi:hypothetical protein
VKNRRNRTLLVAAMICFANVTAAHHPIGRVFTIRETTHIEGKVVRVLLRNPHSFVLLREAGHDEKIWALEWASAKKLSRQGVQAGTIRFGDYLVVTGHPPRKATEYKILIQLLTRQSDGFTWGGRADETVDGFSIFGPLSK